MTLRGKMYDRIDVVFFENHIDNCIVADIAFDKRVPGIVCNILQVLRIAGIGQGIEVYYLIIRSGLEHMPDEVAADKSCSTGYQNFHYSHPKDHHPCFNPGISPQS